MIMSSNTMLSFASTSMLYFPPCQEFLHPNKSSSDQSDSDHHTGKQSQGKLPLSITTNTSRPIIPSAIATLPKKPMRPLTSYHIFFQIEREYIIQTTAGEDADKSIHDNKVYHTDVPRRYSNIKLRPDWYVGPGKRKKRKHRKQHGKIGFLELSRVISARWAQLECMDPETKSFVTKIARGELDDYYKEMKEYKELTKDLMPDDAKKSVVRRASVPKKKNKKLGSGVNYSFQHRAMPRPQMVLSSFQAMDFAPSSAQLIRDMDHFLACIDKKTKHLLPAMPFGSQDQAVDTRPRHQPMCYSMAPSFSTSEQRVQKKRNNMYHRQDSALSISQFNSLLERPVEKQQYVSRPVPNDNHTSNCSSPAAVEVDICDDEILQLWKMSHNQS